MSTRLNTRLQRGVIIIPNAFTLGNLFFGVWAIVSASRGAFELAAWLIIMAGVADMMDGRVARVTKTGSKFGEELDSLVDAISFGVAPAFIMYHLFLAREHWAWVAAWFYITGAVVRLARFNVEQAGHAKVAFHGLPSPAAGMTLASFYPFTQTDLFRNNLQGLPWPQITTALMVVISILMMSHVLYPVVPKFGVRSVKGILTGLVMLACLAAAFTIPRLFFFPALVVYIAYGVLKALVLGFFDRLPEEDLLLDVEGGDEAGAELRYIDYDELTPGRRRRRNPFRRRRRRRGAAGPTDGATRGEDEE
ncbi:MAG: CDP-diacylglycerol--serine O-phosphatidyltransferase [Gemmatimonadetes bacterium]|nr:CDP-diacylglycerol--serine O-phosphatidyltransferase [Gemmatimonadota bacterium]